ncbi:MAG: putative dual-specificity RNA methyltransferase RlmN [Parcubacteria group bacterium ADurb.Bin326]|nr:MAG: putative dual-specificity RNA methyltransferase RlmN [Parcubacteria group bacterium ADurb.Bin326]
MELSKILADQPAYRKKQIQEAVYKQLISDWDEALTLPKDLRDTLKTEMPLAIPAEIINEGRARKALITLNDGLQIEAVLITNRDGRHTVCVSSQVGCPMACTFCATGKMGFKRNLTAQEIVSQVLLFARELKKSEDRVDNVVFMGMGEPLLNLYSVLETIELINSPEGLEIGARSISISTCGMPEGIREIIEFPLQINLAISLHAPNDELRSELMPVASQYSIKEIWRELKNYLAAKKRKVMLEYVMIDNVNDNELYAEELAGLVAELPKGLTMINLIPYNPTGKYRPSPKNQIQKFKQVLEEHGLEVIVRESLGGSIAGACGQLATKK